MFRRLDEVCVGCFGYGLKHLDHSVAGQRNKSIEEENGVNPRSVEGGSTLSLVLQGLSLAVLRRRFLFRPDAIKCGLAAQVKRTLGDSGSGAEGLADFVFMQGLQLFVCANDKGDATVVAEVEFVA